MGEIGYLYYMEDDYDNVISISSIKDEKMRNMIEKSILWKKGSIIYNKI